MMKLIKSKAHHDINSKNKNWAYFNKRERAVIES